MKFSYSAKDINGKTISNIEEASDESHLVARLQEQGFFIVTIQQVREEISQPQKNATSQIKTTFTHNKVNLDDLLIFCRQMSTMIESGVHLLRSLEIISRQVESRELHIVLVDVTNSVKQGNSLSLSLAKHPKVFNQFWVSLVEVGEASGTMPNVLEKLSYYLEQRAAFKSAILSAVIYPIILLVVATGAILCFALFIGPKFKAIFDSFHVELPLLTKVLLAIFEIIKTKFLLIFLGFVGIIWAFKKYISTPKGQLRFEKFIFSLPGAGHIYRSIVVERFTSQMSILVESGVPILYALDICQRMIENKTCESVIGEIKNNVREGKLLAEHMGKSGFFPPMAVQMIAIGEETGELAKMLKSVAKYYQDFIEVVMKRFGTIFEPVMLVVMGGVIGIIVIAMFLPIFSLAQLGGG